MQTSRKLSHALLALFALVMMSASAFAQECTGPGTCVPASSAVSDQKAGSVLYYNFYTSDAANPATRNTRINITNTSSTSGTVVHFFFVNSADCTAADNFLCLTENQTATFTMADNDPGITGFLVAVATDENGCLIPFNFLIGDEYVKTPDVSANLGAEAFAALFRDPVCGDANGNAVLVFDGQPALNTAHYNQAPRVLALDNFASPADGNVTSLVINRVGGDLGAGGVGNVGNLFIIAYDDIENPFSISSPGNRCQVLINLAGLRSVPRFDQIAPSGRSGWLRISTQANVAILGISLNAASQGGFSGGHNLHKLTLTNTTSVTVPVFPSNCD
jgi:hypothetical protein